MNQNLAQTTFWDEMSNGPIALQNIVNINNYGMLNLTSDMEILIQIM